MFIKAPIAPIANSPDHDSDALSDQDVVDGLDDEMMEED